MSQRHANRHRVKKERANPEKVHPGLLILCGQGHLRNQEVFRNFYNCTELAMKETSTQIQKRYSSSVFF